MIHADMIHAEERAGPGHGSAFTIAGGMSQEAEAYSLGAKRRLDKLVAVVALAAFAPALVLLAVAIKIDSRGPVFFSQSRVGIERRRGGRAVPPGRERRRSVQPGRPFRILKLRTMTRDAEAGGPRWAVAGDSRVTRVGRFLRATHLDEFPQFVNVLRGEMSVVGPRPERQCFMRGLEEAVPGYRERLAVLPGITGLAQVVNGYDTDLESVRRKVRLDRCYIDCLCLQTDLALMARTVKTLLPGQGPR